MAKKVQMAVLKSDKNSFSLPGESLVKIADAYFNYKTTCAVEKRRRAEIEAWREMVVTSIKGYFNSVDHLIKTKHEEKMLILNNISNILAGGASSLPPEILLEFTKLMVEVVKTDNLNESIQALKSNINLGQATLPHKERSLLDQSDIIDI